MYEYNMILLTCEMKNSMWFMYWWNDLWIMMNDWLVWNYAFQMYFNTVLTDSAKLLKPLLVFSFDMLAILAGLTRIIQFRNHPVDVYCGWSLGAAIAIYLVMQLTSQVFGWFCS